MFLASDDIKGRFYNCLISLPRCVIVCYKREQKNIHGIAQTLLPKL